jgi:hypothetical protein
MNYPQLHLILNHIPVVALPVVTLFLILAMYFKNIQMKKISLMVLILVGLTTVPTYFTGEPAEHALDGIPSVTEEVISPHEEMAEKMLILSLVTASLAVAAIAFEKNEKKHKGLVYLTLGLAIFTSMGLGYTAHLGGEIRHTEVRADFKK